jgi:hypothetical protein
MKAIWILQALGGQRLTFFMLVFYAHLGNWADEMPAAF